MVTQWRGRGHTVTPRGSHSNPIVKIKTILIKNNNNNSLNYLNEQKVDTQKSVADDESRDASTDKTDDTSQLLLMLNDLKVEWGIAKVTALIAKHGKEYFIEKVELLKYVLKTKSIDNPGAYLQSALTYNYKPTDKQQSQTASSECDKAQSDALRGVLERKTCKAPCEQELTSRWLSKSRDEQQAILSKCQKYNWTYVSSLDALEGDEKYLLGMLLESAWRNFLLER